MTSTAPATFEWDGGVVSGVWNRRRATERALVLAHGAGGNMNAAQLVAVAEGLAERDIANVLRFNFPYAEAGRRIPDPQPRLESCYRAVAEAVSLEFPKPALGGRSMGGRIASHLAADGFPASALVFLAYPLHPPSKPEKIRDAHLKRIKIPMLFLQGTHDPFATPELLHQTVGSLPTATLIEIEGGSHAFRVTGRKPPDIDRELIEAIAGFLDSLQ